MKVCYFLSFVFLLGVVSCSHNVAKNVEKRSVASVNLPNKEVVAKNVEGESPLQGIRSIKKCSFIVGDSGDNENIRVGLNSQDAMAANMLIEIPTSMLPLKDGKSFIDDRGNVGSYEDGVLTVTREKKDDTFGGKEVKEMSIVVSPDLSVVKSAEMTNYYYKFLKSELQAKMKCMF